MVPGGGTWMRIFAGSSRVFGSEPLRRLSRISAPPRRVYRDLRFRMDRSHVSGPLDLEVTPEEVVLLSVVRDVEPHLEDFLDHYLSLGVKHVVLMDNGSEDRTVPIALANERVTILRMGLTFGKYSVRARDYLLRRFTGNGWGLIVDGDEFFDFPLRPKIGLHGLIRYLNLHGYSAMNANMLEMFPSEPLLEQETSIAWRGRHIWFDLSDVIEVPYDTPDVEVDRDEVRVFRGGILAPTFGGSGVRELVKHPLIRPAKGARLISSHHVRYARVADLSGVLLHYKFPPGFLTGFEKIVVEDSHRQHTSSYRSYLKTFEDDPGLTVKTDSAERLDDPQRLLDRGFMTASQHFRQWVEESGGTEPA